ncbi:MAG: hypothetical protein IPK82_26420 [Polyangiaceae bacterium]|nr:hypothetical protein [Polyangiaceae bacterium]
MPTPIHDDDDDLDATPKGVARRITKVAEIIQRANARLERIRTSFVDPPDPDKPAVVAALNSVLSEAGRATTMANELLTRTR